MDSSDFFELLATDPKLYACYKDAANCAEAISAPLGDDIRFLYQPWLAPNARRQVTFLRQNPESELSETIIEFDHAQMGLVRIEFLNKDERVVYKLKMQRMSQSNSLMRYMTTRSHRGLPLATENLGITKLPQRSHGGIIAEMLFKQ